MKYAITGPKGRIFRILEEQTQDSVSITDTQAELFLNDNNKKEGYFIINSEFMKGSDAMKIIQANNKEKLMAEKFASMTQEQQKIELAYNAAAAAFESLSLGKQVLWESVRVSVAKAIRSGDMTKAYEIIATLPIIYEGAETDRAIFLNLFSTL